MDKKIENQYILKLSKPLEWSGQKVEQLDLSGMESLTLGDLDELYDAYEMQGGNRVVLQESSLTFALVVANRVTGQTIEALRTMTARDGIKLKNMVYRFFYREE